MYTPYGSEPTAPTAVPTLKSASVSLNLSGRTDPVKIIVLSAELLAKYAADVIIVSVPWVMIILSCFDLNSSGQQLSIGLCHVLTIFF